MIIKVVLIIIAVLALYVGYEYMRFRHFEQIGLALAAHPTPFVRASGVRSILVVGDSSAAAVGTTDPKYSVAGRLSQLLDASVENLAKSGSRVADVLNQLPEAIRPKYDLILIEVGGNDVTHNTPIPDATRDLDTVLKEARAKSDHVVLITAGDVGEAPIFPWFIRPIMSRRSDALKQVFMQEAQANDALYVDLYQVTEVFKTDYSKYYAADLFHPTDAGYGVWSAEIEKQMSVR
jgi:lysophospholipase L1-like esterase